MSMFSASWREGRHKDIHSIQPWGPDGHIVATAKKHFVTAFFQIDLSASKSSLPPKLSPCDQIFQILTTSACSFFKGVQNVLPPAGAKTFHPVC